MLCKQQYELELLIASIFSVVLSVVEIETESKYNK